MRMRKLDPPGAGLPSFERFYLNLYFRVGCWWTSDNAALASFQASAREILRVVEDHDYDLLSQQIMLPRMQGMEDSSRNWSVLMVLDHLVAVNRFVMDTVRALHHQSEPFDRFDSARFKPSGDVGAEAIDQYREIGQKYWAFAKSHQPLHTSLTFPHPWFGALDGHAWHCFAAAHQKTHRRQIYKILATIGVT